MRSLMLVRTFCYKKIKRPDAFKLVSRPAYEPTSLASHIADKIRTGGPISVADYMRAVLTNPTKGYYMSGDVFGSKGDFTTSPEISPLFGEMIGVWFSNELQKIGSPRPMQLVEFGPGRGTLAADLLRVFKKIPPGDNDISLHLIEVSERLAQIQAQRLGVSEMSANLSETSSFYQHGTTPAGLNVYWYRNLKHVPRAFSIYIAHEFFDALPIHKFQRVDGAWREILISLKNPDEVTSGAEPAFELTISRISNPPLSMLISSDERRDHVEVCPEAADVIANVSQRIEEDGGIGLVVDYGHSATKTDTFRGFKSHKLHDPLISPGSADLTADVDFSFLQRSTSTGVESYGPVSQHNFLTQMGIETRLQNLLPNVSSEQAETLKSGVKMIMEDMGSRFLFLAMFPSVLKEHLKKFPVSGFQTIK